MIGRRQSRLRGGCKGSGLLLALLLLVNSPAVHALQGQSPNRECATCHIMWLLQFKRQDVKPLIPFDPLPVTASGKEDVVATARMCISCHDGFVLDSRYVWQNLARGHPVGQKPSPRVTIPTADGKEIFPLNASGNVYCGTCHSAHGIDWNEKKSTIFLRMSNVDSQLCMACHFERSTGIQEGNHPINKTLAQVPAKLKEAGAKFSDTNQVICQSCHSVHGGRGERLTVLDNHESDLCVACHSDKEAVRSSKHNLAITAANTRNLNNRYPTQSGPCSACHAPHDGRGPRMWARSVADNGDFITNACLGCHGEHGLASTKAIGGQSHPVNVPISALGAQAAQRIQTESNRDSTGVPVQRLPLFDGTGQRVSTGGKVTCLTCHDPHQWKQHVEARTAEEIRTNEGDGSSSFLRIANDKDSSTCTYCHRDKATVVGSKHDMNLTAPNQSNKGGLGVSLSGTCSACHLPHNGAGPRMWARVVTSGIGVEAQCLSCHNAKGPAADKQVGDHSHPLHVKLPEGAFGVDLPVYNLNGIRENLGSQNGLVDCATCHNPHRWSPGIGKPAAPATADLEGDASNSFLRAGAALDDKSNLCAKCHPMQSLVFGTDHDLAVTAPGAADNEVSETGPCGACHAVHNAPEAHRLWVRKLELGQDVPEQMCRSCHRKEGIASAKVPEYLSHPKRLIPNNKGRMRDHETEWINRPVFAQNGDPADIGTISCLTCHNPHKWQPDLDLPGVGKNLEGDAMNSFLRNGETENFLCADCHGADSLFRYKYFHWSKSRAEPRPRKPVPAQTSAPGQQPVPAVPAVP